MDKNGRTYINHGIGYIVRNVINRPRGKKRSRYVVVPHGFGAVWHSGMVDATVTLMQPRTKHSTMMTPGRHRAAHADYLASGRSGRRATSTQLLVRIDPAVLAYAERYGICAPHGRNGLEPLGKWFERTLLDEIRKRRDAEKEKVDQALNSAKKALATSDSDVVSS